MSDTLAFTFADFVASDSRYAAHFAGVPSGKANGSLVPAGSWLEVASGPAADTVPYILLVDESKELHKAIADEAVTAGSRRCRDLCVACRTRRNCNSHAEQLLAKERSIWEERRQKELASQSTLAVTPSPAQGVPPIPDATPAKAAEPAPEAEATQKSDEPYIETLRCTKQRVYDHQQPDVRVQREQASLHRRLRPAPIGSSLKRPRAARSPSFIRANPAIRLSRSGGAHEESRTLQLRFNRRAPASEPRRQR